MIDLKRLHQEPRDILCDAEKAAESPARGSPEEQRRTRILRFYQNFSLTERSQHRQGDPK